MISSGTTIVIKKQRAGYRVSMNGRWASGLFPDEGLGSIAQILYSGKVDRFTYMRSSAEHRDLAKRLRGIRKQRSIEKINQQTKGNT